MELEPRGVRIERISDFMDNVKHVSFDSPRPGLALCLVSFQMCKKPGTFAGLSVHEVINHLTDQRLKKSRISLFATSGCSNWEKCPHSGIITSLLLGIRSAPIFAISVVKPPWR